MNANTANPKTPRELTGKSVLLCFIGFFGIVAAVNAIMVRAAVTTFAGTKTDSAYRAGLDYNAEAAAASAQDAMNWRVTGQIVRVSPEESMLVVDVEDARRLPIRGIEVSARLAHPLNAKLDRSMTLARIGERTFRGITDASTGQWELTIEVTRDGARVYRTLSRVVLK